MFVTIYISEIIFTSHKVICEILCLSHYFINEALFRPHIQSVRLACLSHFEYVTELVTHIKHFTRQLEVLRNIIFESLCSLHFKIYDETIDSHIVNRQQYKFVAFDNQ